MATRGEEKSQANKQKKARRRGKEPRRWAMAYNVGECWGDGSSSVPFPAEKTANALFLGVKIGVDDQ
jgi:hypothetical protein